MQKKAVLLAVIGVGLFLGGYKVASMKYRSEIETAKAEYYSNTQFLEKHYREKEREQAEDLARAIDERNEAQRRLSTIERNADGVRVELREARRRLSEANSHTEDFYRKRLAEGAELIGRSNDLLSRCVRLAEKSALDKETVVRLTNTR